MTANELPIRIPGEPFAQPRSAPIPLMKDGKPVLASNGRPILIKYDPKEAKAWKTTAQQHMAFGSDDGLGFRRTLPSEYPLTGPIALVVTAVFTCPTSDHRKTLPRPRRWHTKRPDADNVLKAVKDAAKGVLWLDDSQVCRETCVKIIGAQGEAPHVLIQVRPLGEYSDLAHPSIPS